MKLPHADRAVVDVEKLRNYCLSPSHPRGKHKARVFARVLGLTAADADELRQRILSAVILEDAIPTDQDEYGQRYAVDFRISRQGNEALVRSLWIIRASEDFPRMTSCYVL
ncbi:MAG: hypothetical protein IT313_07115 [Anaerolineales bacterium]|nr:hypothetical protein [Anaerolineales bacterium]